MKGKNQLTDVIFEQRSTKSRDTEYGKAFFIGNFGIVLDLQIRPGNNER